MVSVTSHREILENPRTSSFRARRSHGKLVNLGERECSTRAPTRSCWSSPLRAVMTDKVRRKMGSLVARRKAGNTNAGSRVPDGRRRQGFSWRSTPPPGEHAAPRSPGRTSLRSRFTDRPWRADLVQAERGDVHRALDRMPVERRTRKRLAVPGVITLSACRAVRAARGTFAHSECTVSPYTTPCRQDHVTAAIARKRFAACAARSR